MCEYLQKFCFQLDDGVEELLGILDNARIAKEVELKTLLQHNNQYVIDFLSKKFKRTGVRFSE